MASISTEVTAERALIIVDGDISRIADKDYKMVAMAQEAMSGRLLIQDPSGGDPIEITDHVWLLQFAGLLCCAASERMAIREAANAAKSRLM